MLYTAKYALSRANEMNAFYLRTKFEGYKYERDKWVEMAKGKCGTICDAKLLCAELLRMGVSSECATEREIDLAPTIIPASEKDDT